MPPKIIISVDKPSIPPGMVLLEDAGSLSSGLHDSLARLIQRQLGFPWRANLRSEAKRLTRIALTGVSTGSGVLLYEGLPTPGVEGRHPSVLAAFDLISGIRAYADSHIWPAYLPAVVRNRMGHALATTICGADDKILMAAEDEGMEAHCEISPSIRDAMQVPESFLPDEPVEIVGTIVEIDKRNFSFKIEASGRTITAEVSEWQFKEIDSDLRWGRIFIAGFPRDIKGRTVHRVAELRAATDEEVDGFNLTRESRRGEKTETYLEVRERAESLLSLKEGWDTYRARMPGKRATFFMLHFLRDAIGVLLDHGITVPPPFLAPTTSGGVQLEWSIGSRELELEIPEKGRFEYLALDGFKEAEGDASRWAAMRLLRWVITGEGV